MTLRVTSSQCQKHADAIQSPTHEHTSSAFTYAAHFISKKKTTNQIKLLMFAAAHALPEKSPTVTVSVCFP